jgi:hypothetical protein
VADAPSTSPEPQSPPTPPTPPTPEEPPGVIPPGSLPPFVTPQLPQASVDVSLPAPPTRTVRVASGDAVALQRAIDGAIAGDEIVLPAGSVYTGSFQLANRADAGTVVIRSESVPVAFGTRITPSAAGSLATLRTTNVFPALKTAPGAHGWRVIGITIQLTDGAEDNYGIVTLGSGTETAMALFPRDIVIDRVVISGTTNSFTSRCLSLNGIRLAVVNSWLAECHARGRDSQAILGWTGTGPFLIENNYLEGAGQAIMFGGGDPRVAGVIPSDITIRRNYLFKPLSWANGRWTVKAAFELKNAERVLFEGNVIENHWSDAQTGFAILISAASQENIALWSTVRDLTVRRNAIRNATSGMNISSRFTLTIPASRRFLFVDNSFENVGRDPIVGSSGRFMQLLGDTEDMTIVQNTFFGINAANGVLLDGLPSARLVLSHNALAATQYGIFGTGSGEGTLSLARYAPGSVVRGNALTGHVAARYPAGNTFPATMTLADFVAPAAGNYSLRAAVPYSSVGGVRTGVDGAAVLAAIAGVTAR